MTAESNKSDRYNAREAEPRWQRVWDERGIFRIANPAQDIVQLFLHAHRHRLHRFAALVAQ